ncbi:MAG: hypothetical protein DBX55_02780 [Verrucomicrobia bacterium]|nr:MAG: hypothetical protein DBX55_02780 [Verrucomicrobiota bacterium]
MSENRIKLEEGRWLEISRVEVAGDLYASSDGAEKLGDGRYAVSLDAEEAASLGIANIQALADKFAGSGNANEE